MIKRRLRLQFGLRFLFLLTALVGVWLGLEVRHAQQQERAVETIRRAGGTNIFYDYESGVPHRPDWLRQIVGHGLGARVSRVNALYLELDDSDMDELSALTDLRELWLWENPITDEGLARLHLASFRNLELLNVGNTQITDNGIIHVCEIPKLTFLDLSDTTITDAALAQLANCQTLETLHLEGTAVTDAGLMQLRALSNLRELNLFNTHVTDAGGSEFQQALPKCTVYWGKI